jgi:hypothetical protein
MHNNDPLSFGKDIRPLFTTMDVDHMASTMNLADRDSVYQHADAIYRAVSEGAMPPPTSSEPRWTPEMCATFDAWRKQGGPP